MLIINRHCFIAGDFVTVIDPGENGWCKATLPSGDQGVIPEVSDSGKSISLQ